jgi:hypothetical protein
MNVNKDYINNYEISEIGKGLNILKEKVYLNL